METRQENIDGLVSGNNKTICKAFTKCKYFTSIKQILKTDMGKVQYT